MATTASNIGILRMSPTNDGYAPGTKDGDFLMTTSMSSERAIVVAPSNCATPLFVMPLFGVGIGTRMPEEALHVAGNVRVSGHFISSAPMGKEPLKVASSFMVANLNAEYVGGRTAAYLAELSNVTGTLAVTRGGTGVTSLSAGNILVGNGTDGVQVASGLNWEASNSILNVTKGIDVDGYIRTKDIRVTGTVVATGADYAEAFSVASSNSFGKGDIVGMDVQGMITDVYRNAVSFGIVSSEPCLVGNVENVEQAWQRRKERIAFCGQVPVNVNNASVGDYVIPHETSVGGIEGLSVSASSISFEDYKRVVGKVVRMGEDGRPVVIVKLI
jgi:hypothetical protein